MKKPYKPYKPSKRDIRIDKFKTDLIDAKLLPQGDKEERKVKAQVIRKLYKSLKQDDIYYITNFHSKRTNDLELAKYIETLGVRIIT